MTTKIISLKEYRNKITSLWKEAKSRNIRYIVLFHAKPILEVKPYPEEELIFDDNDLTSDYYKTVEQNMEFWKNKKDDDIFLIK